MMKQLPINIVVSVALLGVVFFAANQGLPDANASNAIQAPALSLERANDGMLHVRGFGFRPGSLVNVQVQHQDSGIAIANADTWVDTNGAFVTDMNLEEIAAGRITAYNDLIVLATASTASISLPLAGDRASIY